MKALVSLAIIGIVMPGLAAVAETVASGGCHSFIKKASLEPSNAALMDFPEIKGWRALLVESRLRPIAPENFSGPLKPDRSFGFAGATSFGSVEIYAGIPVPGAQTLSGIRVLLHVDKASRGDWWRAQVRRQAPEAVATARVRMLSINVLRRAAGLRPMNFSLTDRTETMPRVVNAFAPRANRTDKLNIYGHVITRTINAEYRDDAKTDAFLQRAVGELLRELNLD